MPPAARTVAPRALSVSAALVAAVFALPVVLMILGSLQRTGSAPPRGIAELLSAPTTAAYSDAVELGELWRPLANSLLVAAVAVPASVLIASFAGLAMRVLPPRWTRVLLVASLLALMVPLSALLVPRFYLFRTAGLIDTYVPLVAPALLGGSPLLVLLYYWAFTRIPRELLDAARLEGLSALAIWRRVAMPLVRPVTAAAAGIAFVLSWGSVVEPLVYLVDDEKFTIPLALRRFAEVPATDYPMVLAAATVASVPPVLVLFLVQRRLFGGVR